MIMIDLSGSDKNLLHPKKLEESLKTNKKAPVGVSFAGPPNHPFVSSRHVHPDYHESENYDEVGDSLISEKFYVCTCSSLESFEGRQVFVSSLAADVTGAPDTFKRGEGLIWDF